MKAFWIDAGNHQYVEEYIDSYARYETGWFGGLVYAETASQAKHLFIKSNNDNNHNWRDPEFEYTDKMSIRVLATEADEKWTAGWVGFEDDYEGESLWMRGKRSKFGEQMYQEWFEGQKLLEVAS